MGHRVCRRAVAFDHSVPGQLELFLEQEPRGRALVSSEHVVLFVNRDAGLGARRPSGARCEHHHEKG